MLIVVESHVVLTASSPIRQRLIFHQALWMAVKVVKMPSALAVSHVLQLHAQAVILLQHWAKHKINAKGLYVFQILVIVIDVDQLLHASSVCKVMILMWQHLDVTYLHSIVKLKIV